MNQESGCFRRHQTDVSRDGAGLEEDTGTAAKRAG
jgi:hypothetical protein